MPDQPSVTTREAVLASLLAHALLLIYVLIFPETFTWSGRTPFARADRDEIPVRFLQQPPDAAPPRSAALGDAGRQKVSEPRRPDAPPPANEDPYSVGNTRNRFVAPPMPERTRPSPDPGPPGSPSADPPGALAQAQRGAGGDEGRPGEPSAPDDGDASSPFYLPPRGEGGEGKEGKSRSLRAALGRMSAGMSGGAPLKFDNPAGGLSGPLGGLSFDTPGFDWGPYARRIYWVIWTNWTTGWPPAAWAGLKGTVTVHFTIWRDGRISDIRVLDPSGTPAFDTCATLALEASSPLPPLPEEFPGASEGITARFLYNTESDGL